MATDDLRRINKKRQTWVPGNEQAQAEQLVQSGQLKGWMVSATSSQLLVHGDYEGRQYMSSLSLFCTSLFESLAARGPRFIPLVFFCGLHTDRSTDEHTGGRAIIQTFICQLLCQFDFDTRTLASEKLAEDLILSAPWTSCASSSGGLSANCHGQLCCSACLMASCTTRERSSKMTWALC